MSQPEQYPRETGSQIPEGAEQRADGSYVESGVAPDIQSTTHDDEGSLIVTEEQAALRRQQEDERLQQQSDESARELASQGTPPRELGTPGAQGQEDDQ